MGQHAVVVCILGFVCTHRSIKRGTPFSVKRDASAGAAGQRCATLARGRGHRAWRRQCHAIRDHARPLPLPRLRRHPHHPREFFFVCFWIVEKQKRLCLMRCIVELAHVNHVIIDGKKWILHIETKMPIILQRSTHSPHSSTRPPSEHTPALPLAPPARSSSCTAR